VAGSDWKETIAELEEEKQRLLDAHAELWRRRDSEFGGKLDSAARRWTLTDRQLQVLSGLARGRSNKELANELGCSMKTVETHVTELLRRSHQDSRLSLVATFWRDV
jgi:DNA-binding NarL/FixJ family response regulator